jgi:serine/threonine protein kinase/Tol biopolymer transport system component
MEAPLVRVILREDFMTLWPTAVCGRARSAFERGAHGEGTVIKSTSLLGTQMIAERWRRIVEAYESVVSHPPASRSKILDEACAGDDELRREVESMLRAREEAGNFLSPEHLQLQIRELSEPDVALGRTFGRYHIQSIIGAGGMGEVYLARDIELDRQVALKVLPAQFTGDKERVARFKREARAASALNHPNIVTIYDIGETRETHYIAAEFVEGITLRDRLALGPMELEETFDIAIQCARALDAAHQVGIVHRDIKPENIMVRRDGVVKLVDFGLARSREAGPELLNTTKTGEVFGTPRYMSPEQARGQKLDARTDIFSLGAVLYEMVTGRPAFPGTTTAEVFAALLGSTSGPPEDHVLMVPDALNAILTRALEKDREARYQTIRELEPDLQDFNQHRTAGRSPILSRKRVPARTGWARNRGLRGAALATVPALVVGLGLLWVLWPKAHESPPDTRARESAPDARAFSIVPVTSPSGLTNYGSFSPDGREIAFSRIGGKPQRNIYIEKIGASEPVQLTFGREDDRGPVWSPDGRYIAFCRLIADQTPVGRFAVYVMSAAGGGERRITEGGEGVSWAPDGKTLAVAGPPDASGIFRVSLETGERTQLTRSGPYLDNFPVFSPDGQWIAFARSLTRWTREVFIVPSDGGTPRQLTFDGHITHGEAWTADSKEIVFSSGRDKLGSSGGMSLWRIPIAGGVPRRLSVSLQGGFYPAISRQGNQLLFTESFQNTNIYASDGAGFAGRFAPGRFGASRGLILSPRRDDSSSISPTDGRIAFVSMRTGNEEIWVCDRDCERPTQLTAFEGPPVGTPRWSPEGRSIAFDSVAAGNADIYVINGDGGAPRRLTTGPFSNFMPSWSPDGKRIYFKSDRSGSYQIWWVPSAGGAATQITHGGASEAFASPDGKMVYFTKPNGSSLWTVPVDGGTERPVPELEPFDKIFRSWGVVREGIYFISKVQGKRQTVRFFSFVTRRVTPLLTLEGELIWNYPNVALSPDGRSLLTARFDSSR